MEIRFKGNKHFRQVATAIIVDNSAIPLFYNGNSIFDWIDMFRVFIQRKAEAKWCEQQYGPSQIPYACVIQYSGIDIIVTNEQNNNKYSSNNLCLDGPKSLPNGTDFGFDFGETIRKFIPVLEYIH